MSNRERPASKAQRRLAEVQRQQRKQQRRVRLLAGGVLVAVAVVAAVLITVLQPGATHAPGVTGAAAGATVDGISCSTSEQTAFHIHAHLAIYDGSSSQPVPAGIGIPGPQQVQNGFVDGGKCLYWLHTHDQTGIIHIESPVQRAYTLGNFFHIWGRTLTPTQVGNAKGTVIAYVNGKRFTGDPATIRLTAHSVIQLDVNSQVAPRPYTFPQGL
jgi:hypothetical protein